MEGLVKGLDDSLFTITTEQRDRVVTLLMDWFNREARLKSVPDLADRLTKMASRVQKMAKNLDVGIQDGKLVVRADADSEALLSLLRRGSDWFDPHPSVEAAVLEALVEGAR